MKTNLIIALVISALPIFSTLGQNYETGFVWAENPAYSEIIEEYESENVIGIFLHEKYEYYYDSQGDLLLNHAEHRRFRLNNDDAVNSFNKISVSLASTLEVTELKARVIKPNGQLIEFDQNNIKEIIDDESGRNYKIFAIDGIETGDEIEYLITKKMSGINFRRVFYQFDYPLQLATFELISPPNLLYATKGYNGFPDAVAEVIEDERNRLFSTLENVPLLKDMEYSYFNPRRARIEFTLEYNHARGRTRLLTWNDAAQRIYEMMYEDVDPKIINKWLETIKLTDGTNLSKVSRIEDYIKNNIYIQEYSIPEFNDLEFILSNQVSGEQGIVRLYVNLFKVLGINHEIVLTSDRTNIPFDPDFESWNYLDKYLIYIPDGDVYIDPVDDFYRVGCIDGEYTDTYGLFIKLLSIGTFESATGNIKYIEPTPYRANYDNMHIEIILDVDKAEARIINVRGFKGLGGGSLHEIYKVVDLEYKQDFLRDIMEPVASNPVYDSLKVMEKSDVDFLKDAEFLIHSDFSSSSFLQIAGNRLLLNIGETIGPQNELYFEEDREIGGDSGFNRWFYRRIIFEIPPGYRIVNPDAANINVVQKSDEKVVFGFISTHYFSDNQFIVEIDEYYKQIQVEPEQFEGFRNVINAAADFNKVVLVLEEI